MTMDSLKALATVCAAYKAGAELPPVIVDMEGIIDGRHRYNVLKGEGYTHAYAFVQDRAKASP
jgi:hypothetical protein